MSGISCVELGISSSSSLIPQRLATDNFIKTPNTPDSGCSFFLAGDDLIPGCASAGVVFACVERRLYPPSSTLLILGDACSIGRAYGIKGGVYYEGNAMCAQRRDVTKLLGH